MKKFLLVASLMLSCISAQTTTPRVTIDKVTTPDFGTYYIVRSAYFTEEPYTLEIFLLNAQNVETKLQLTMRPQKDALISWNFFVIPVESTPVSASFRIVDVKPAQINVLGVQ